MNRHICQATTARADRLQILEAVLGTPRKMLSWRYSDRELLEIEDEAVLLGRELEAEGRCTGCGHIEPPQISVRDTMDKALADLWGAL